MSLLLSLHVLLFLFTDPPTTTIYTSCHPLSLHDALPICTLTLEAGIPYNPAGYYYSTSPPVIAAGKIIVGGAVNDNYSTQSQSGVIRAYDVNTGELVWNWDSGNPTQTQPLAPGETYTDRKSTRLNSSH